MPVFSILIILFFITSSITVFDKRLIQARKRGDVPADEPMLPPWVGIIWWIEIGLALTMLIMDWKRAIGVFIIIFVLSILPVLEIIGNIFMRPFRPKNKVK